MTTGASFARGASKQDYETPKVFIDAVEHRFGPLAWDLAASAENAKARLFFTKADDSLDQNWGSLRGNLWLNPPFGNIAPWATKCGKTYLNPGTQILLLIPASIGSNWYAQHVYPHARTYALVGRLSFDGKSPFPKDCILSVFPGEGFEVWDWRK